MEFHGKQERTENKGTRHTFEKLDREQISLPLKGRKKESGQGRGKERREGGMEGGRIKNQICI